MKRIALIILFIIAPIAIIVGVGFLVNDTRYSKDPPLQFANNYFTQLEGDQTFGRFTLTVLKDEATGYEYIVLTSKMYSSIAITRRDK